MALATASLNAIIGTGAGRNTGPARQTVSPGGARHHGQIPFHRESQSEMNAPSTTIIAGGSAECRETSGKRKLASRTSKSKSTELDHVRDTRRA